MTAKLSKSEQVFANAIAALARQHGISPRSALPVFGTLAAHMVEFEVRENGKKRESCVSEALSLFADGLMTQQRATND